MVLPFNETFLAVLLHGTVYLHVARCLDITEFKIRRLRTTTTVKHATTHDQNHVTVHFSRVVQRLR